MRRQALAGRRRQLAQRRRRLGAHGAAEVLAQLAVEEGPGRQQQGEV